MRKEYGKNISPEYNNLCCKANEGKTKARLTNRNVKVFINPLTNFRPSRFCAVHNTKKQLL